MADEFEQVELTEPREILEQAGCSVVLAANGVEALDMLADAPADLVLLDVGLPGGMDGLEALRHMKEAHPEVAVVMISGHDDDGSAARALEAGAERFLVKPVSRDRLLSALADLEADRAFSS